MIFRKIKEKLHVVIQRKNRIIKFDKHIGK